MGAKINKYKWEQCQVRDPSDQILLYKEFYRVMFNSYPCTHCQLSYVQFLSVYTPYVLK
jgi:hypothetical protein